MLAILHAAGWPIWFLIATSIIGLALIIERLISLRDSRYLNPKQIDDAFELAALATPPAHRLRELEIEQGFGRLAATLISLRNQPETIRHQATEEQGRSLAFMLHRYLPALATVAVIAPLLGLFGTVVGMIELFGSYQPQGSDPSQLARGISIALYNTGFGILIAIVALIAHRYFSSRADYLLHRLELEASRLNRFLSSVTP